MGQYFQTNEHGQFTFTSVHAGTEKLFKKKKISLQLLYQYIRLPRTRALLYNTVETELIQTSVIRERTREKQIDREREKGSRQIYHHIIPAANPMVFCTDTSQ